MTKIFAALLLALTLSTGAFADKGDHGGADAKADRDHSRGQQGGACDVTIADRIADHIVPGYKDARVAACNHQKEIDKAPSGGNRGGGGNGAGARSGGHRKD